MAKSPDRFLPPPIDGIDWRGPIMDAPLTTAYHIANFICRENDLFSPGGLALPSAALGGAGAVGSIWENAAGTIYYSQTNGIYNLAGALQIALTEEKGSWLNAAVAGGQYTFFFNGTDTPKVENAGVFANIAWAGASIKADLFQATMYRQRIYVLDRNRMGFWYLPAGAVTGAEAFYDMGTLAARGGYTLAIGTLTLDSGNGPDDLLAIYTSAGEVILFSGNDPAATTWTPVGVYFIGAPFGGFTSSDDRPVKLMAKLGGDLLIMTNIGLVSVYEVMRGESIATIRCLTDKIWPGIRWLGNRHIRVDVLSSLGLLLLSWTSATHGVFALNLKTGAWSRLLEDPTNPGLQLGDCNVWLESTRLNRVYTAARFGTAIYVAFNDSYNAAYGMACQHVIQYNFTRLESLQKLNVLDIRPMFVAETPFAISVGFAKNLGPTYNEQTITTSAEFWSRTQSYAHHLAQPPGFFSAVEEYMTQRWLTVANDVAQCAALRYRATLPILGTEQFMYVGTDLRNTQGGMLGP